MQRDCPKGKGKGKQKGKGGMYGMDWYGDGGWYGWQPDQAEGQPQEGSEATKSTGDVQPELELGGAAWIGESPEMSLGGYLSGLPNIANLNIFFSQFFPPLLVFFQHFPVAAPIHGPIIGPS